MHRSICDSLMIVASLSGSGPQVTMAEEQSYVKMSYVDLCAAYASLQSPQLTSYGLLYYKLTNITFGR